MASPPTAFTTGGQRSTALKQSSSRHRIFDKKTTMDGAKYDWSISHCVLRSDNTPIQLSA